MLDFCFYIGKCFIQQVVKPCRDFQFEDVGQTQAAGGRIRQVLTQIEHKFSDSVIIKKLNYLTFPVAWVQMSSTWKI